MANISEFLSRLPKQEALDFIQQLEGDYKWYVIGFVLVVITMLVTKFIFKTIKWFIIITAAAFLVFSFAYYFIGF